MRCNIGVIILITAYVNLANAQNISSMINGSSAGMGNATAALSDEWSLFNNIGGLGRVQEKNIAFIEEVCPELPGANRTALSLTYPLRRGAVGIGLFRFGDAQYNQQSIAFGMGHCVGATSIGIQVHYMQVQSEGYGTFGVTSFDMGGVMKITPQITVGAYAHNMMQSFLHEPRPLLPWQMAAGMSFQINPRFLLVSEIEKSDGYNITGKFGMEWNFNDKVFLRAGLNVQPQLFCTGFGVNKKRMSYQFAQAFNWFSGQYFTASARYRILKDKK